MLLERSDRGFELITHPVYSGVNPARPEARVVQASSAIGGYEDSFEKPGSSFLWVGENHHLNREEVTLLVKHLQAWLATGSLEVNSDKE